MPFGQLKKNGECKVMDAEGLPMIGSDGFLNDPAEGFSVSGWSLFCKTSGSIGFGRNCDQEQNGREPQSRHKVRTKPG